LARKPASLTFDQAAALPVSGLTALQGLRDAGRVEPGQHVLIIGASGGVGTFAVQIAKAFGAEVTAVCSTAKTGLAESIGADHVIDYTRDNYLGGPQRYDLILDIAGNSSLSRLRQAAPSRGRTGPGENRHHDARRRRRIGSLTRFHLLLLHLKCTGPDRARPASCRSPAFTGSARG
jgi:D-arabinose 1-dehydrogenase-like Zn-dependent alcohol dehydrogenase